MSKDNFRDYDGEIIELFAEIEDDLWVEFQDEFIDRQIVYDNIIEKLNDMSNKQKEEIITRYNQKLDEIDYRFNNKLEGKQTNE
jgi:hypothetical protein